MCKVIRLTRGKATLRTRPLKSQSSLQCQCNYATLLLMALHYLTKKKSQHSLPFSNLSKFCLTHFSSAISATPFHAICSCYLSIPWLPCLPFHLLPIYPNSPHPSRPSSIITSSVSFLLIFLYPSSPEYSLLLLSSHGILTYWSTLYILPCLSSLLDCEFFIFLNIFLILF